MAISQLNPYLFFDGTAAQAIALYQKALGARAGDISRFGEAPGMEDKPEMKDLVMHAELRIGAGTVMVSDSMPGEPAATDSNTHVCLNFDEAGEMAAKFDALAEGGTVTMPLQDTFWGARFGTLTDKFGIRWMFNCPLQNPA
jgi:PhnB protein